MTREMTITIGEKEAGYVLSELLAGRFTYHSLAEWELLIAEGRISVSGKAATPDMRLRVGDSLRYDASGIPEPSVDTNVEVVFDDPFLLAVNKSGNLPCHPGGRYFNHTLWALIQERHNITNPVFINRIDRETSGLVLVGKAPEAAHNLWKQFAAHKVSKLYTVFVEGEFPERLVANGWLVPDRMSIIRKKRRFFPAEPGSAPPEQTAVWAESAFKRERVCDGFSVVRAIPRTGRLHQLRATLLAVGFPLVGDKVYGLDELFFLRFCDDSLSVGDWARLRIKRQALHAGYLQFHHPIMGDVIELDAPLPLDMQHLMEHKSFI